MSAVEIWQVVACLGMVAGLVLGAGTRADDGLRQLGRYRLSMDKLRRYVVAMEQLGVAARSSLGDAASLDVEEIAASIAGAGPDVLQVVDSANLTPMDLALIPLAVQAAEATLALEERGRRVLAPGANVENVELLRANRAEWQSLKSRLRRRAPQPCLAA